MICELCNKTHNGKYGSGRFCNTKCARAFSSKAKRQEINKRVSIKLKNNIPWNKGLTKETNISVYKTSQALKGRKISNKTRKKISIIHIGKKLSEESRKKLSIALKGKTGGYRQGGHKGNKGRYNNIWCDSSYELAFLVYSFLKGIFVIRCTEKFVYMGEDNKQHFYYPDFILGKTIIEVKNYYRKEVELKKQAVIKQGRNIIILYKEDILPIIEYLKQYYNINDIKQLYKMRE